MKAERFIQTLLREWAYALPYRSSDTRAADLPRWLRHYNHERPMLASLAKHHPPGSRLTPEQPARKSHLVLPAIRQKRYLLSLLIDYQPAALDPLLIELAAQLISKLAAQLIGH